jgi:hypothetical protein
MCTAVIIAGLLGGALAQNNNNGSANTGMTKHEAPIGHRQPTLKGELCAEVGDGVKG